MSRLDKNNVWVNPCVIVSGPVPHRDAIYTPSGLYRPLGSNKKGNITTFALGGQATYQVQVRNGENYDIKLEIVAEVDNGYLEFCEPSGGTSHKTTIKIIAPRARMTSPGVETGEVRLVVASSRFASAANRTIRERFEITSVKYSRVGSPGLQGPFGPGGTSLFVNMI